MTLKKTTEFRPVAVALFCALSVLATAFMAQAYTSPVDESRDDYAVGMSRKLGRGVANTGLGWMELFKGVQTVGQEDGFWAGATWGPIYGTVNAVKRTAAGVYETATFPIQNKDRFEPILEPEFVTDNTN